jgi:hypothetical protein
MNDRRLAAQRVVSPQGADSTGGRARAERAEQVVERLREELQRWEQARRAIARGHWLLRAGAGADVSGEELAQPTPQEVVSTGVAAWDALLPGQGIRRGSVVEFLGQAGSGAATLAWVLAVRAIRHWGGVAVVVERQGRRFYPPAAAVWGVPLQRCLWIEAPNGQLYAWAIDQTLRCPAVAVVWTVMARGNALWSRRWQLAAEAAGTLGLFVRPLTAQGQPTWADVQMVVTPCVDFEATAASMASAASTPAVRLLQVQIVRCRYGPAGASVRLWLDDQTGQIGLWQGVRDETRGLSMAPAVASAATLGPTALLARKAAGTVRA